MADENDGIKEKENQRSKRKPGKAAALFQKKREFRKEAESRKSR